MRTHRTATCLVAAAMAVSVVTLAAQTPARPQPGRTTAFVNVSVLPMHTNVVRPDMTVIVTDGRIVSIGPSSATPAPTGAAVIDGRGKFLMPGLTEMHGHIPPPTSPAQLIEDVLFLYVANGVTTVRGMQGAPGQLALRERSARSEIVAPTLLLAGPALSGTTARTPDEAIAIVKQQKQEGWDLLKVQTGLSRETYDAMVATAKDLGIRAGGHVPAGVGIERAMAAQATIDHIDGFVEHLNGASAPVPDAALRELAARTQASGVWIVPTLYVWETLRGAVSLESRTGLPELKYLPKAQVEQWTTQLSNRLRNPQFNADGARHYIENRKRLLKALNDAGARILLGSDAPQQFNVPGFSVHREMAQMVEAGMSPYDVLRSGTASIGEHFLAAGGFGSVALGHRADLILLDANPLLDVANASKRSGVMLRGRWIPEAEIQTRLAAIAKANGF